ncbi:hypothetical protein [Roseiflexus sp.]|uniref:hypothetical protein n=1 Tax=Roseiflexus sp. TaxID=2562120 RepID=UPI00398B8560
MPVIAAGLRNTSCTCQVCGDCERANRCSQTVFCHDLRVADPKEHTSDKSAHGVRLPAVRLAAVALDGPVPRLRYMG